MKRYHVMTDKGRKIVWAPSSNAARAKAEAHGLAVSSVREQPDPLLDMEPTKKGGKK